MLSLIVVYTPKSQDLIAKERNDTTVIASVAKQSVIEMQIASVASRHRNDGSLHSLLSFAMTSGHFGEFSFLKG